MIRESQTVEFKESWRDSHLKIICAFANTDGGKLVVGVRDDGKLVGVKDSKRLLKTLPDKIRNKLGIIPSVSVVRKDGKEIIEIDVKPSSMPVSYDGKYYVRSGSTTVQLDGKGLAEFLMKKLGKTWDEYPLEKVSFDEIDPDAIEKFKDWARERIPSIAREKDPKLILEKLNLLVDGKLTRASILLFGKNPQKYFIQAYIKIGKFVSEADVVSTDEIEGNLFEQVERAMDILQTKYLMRLSRFEGIRRRDVLEYPEDALREAIINAVIHRDYLGTSAVQIRVYDDKLVIMNEGKLPPEVPIEKLKEEHVSKPRNPLLARTFYFAGLIEAWGRGTIKIVESCRRNGLPEPDFIEEHGIMKVIFYKDIYNEEYLKKLGLKDRQIRAVMYIKENGKITNKEYQDITGIKKRQATEDLKYLEKLGILERVGTTGRGVYYVLKRHERGKRSNNGAQNGHWTIRYFCEKPRSDIKELLKQIKEKHEIHSEIITNIPWDEQKDREIYEKYFKPRSKTLKERVGKPITKLRSKKARHYFVSIPGTIGIFRDDRLEYWEFATDEGIKLLREILVKGEEEIKEILKETR